MELNEMHYIRLAAALQFPDRPSEPVQVTIERLAGLLCCTPRNVKFILRRLEQKHLIEWSPGRGRGHASSLKFGCRLEDLLEERLLAMMDKGKVKEAMELIGCPDIGSPVKERLWAAFNRQMGLHSNPESPSRSDVLRMMRNRKLEKLDPAFVFTAFEAYLLSQVCSTLVVYDAETGGFTPGLAHHWEHHPDYTSWTFYLRKGVRFHHGRPLTSADVTATMDRLFRVGSSALWQYRDVQRVEAVGEYAVRFDLKTPNRFSLHLTANLFLSILPHDVEFAGVPVGTGPFRIADLNGDCLMLEAFDGYYGYRPLLDRVEIWFFPERLSNDREYRLPEGEQEELLPWSQYHSSIDYPALGSRYLMFNMRKPGIHQRMEIRQAFRILYDRCALIRELGGNRYRPADSFLPWISQNSKFEEASLDEAAELLKRGKYRGEPLTLAYAFKKEEKEEAEWLLKRCKQAGVNLKLHPFLGHSDIRELAATTDLLLAEEVLEDDWEWGIMNYYLNASNYLHLLMDDRTIGWLESVLAPAVALDHRERQLCIQKAEEMVRGSCWLLYGCHLNKRASLSGGLHGQSAGAFGFLDISKLWVKQAGKV